MFRLAFLLCFVAAVVAHDNHDKHDNHDSGGTPSQAEMCRTSGSNYFGPACDMTWQGRTYQSEEACVTDCLFYNYCTTFDTATSSTTTSSERSAFISEAIEALDEYDQSSTVTVKETSMAALAGSFVLGGIVCVGLYDFGIRRRRYKLGQRQNVNLPTATFSYGTAY